VEIPSINLPNTIGLPNTVLPRPLLDQPTAVLPSYTPIVVAPNNLAPPAGVPTVDQEALMEEQERREENGEKPLAKPQPAEVKRINVPLINIQIPVPKEEILITAGTTASVSVIATLTVTSLFKQTVKVMKPIIMQLAKRIQKKFNGNKGGNKKPETEPTE